MRNKALSAVVAVGFMLGTTTVGLAQTAQDRAPGQQMQDKGSVRGQPGASGYAPGQKMQDKGSKAGQPGASGYAPGQQELDKWTGNPRRSEFREFEDPLMVQSGACRASGGFSDGPRLVNLSTVVQTERARATMNRQQSTSLLGKHHPESHKGEGSRLSLPLEVFPSRHDTLHSSAAAPALSCR